MKESFYTRLQEVIAECEAHPYANTDKFMLPGWEGRISKSNIGEWTDEEYDILLNRNECSGFQIPGTGTHSGGTPATTPRKSSSRKYMCPCCGMSVRATKAVNIACMDCNEQMLLAM